MSWLPGLKRALVVQDEGVALPVRGIVNIVGAGITASDDPANGRTNLAFSPDVVGTKDPTPNTVARRGAGGECGFLDVITPLVESAAGNLTVSANSGDLSLQAGGGSAAFFTTGGGANIGIGNGGDFATVTINPAATLLLDVASVARATLTAIALTLAVPLALGTTPPATGDIRLGTGAIVNFKGAGYLNQNDGHSLLAWNTSKNITLGDAGDVPLLDLAAAEVRISTADADQLHIMGVGLVNFDAALATPILGQAQLAGTGATAGKPLRIRGQKGQNQANDVANPAGGDLILEAGRGGTNNIAPGANGTITRAFAGVDTIKDWLSGTTLSTTAQNNVTTAWNIGIASRTANGAGAADIVITAQSNAGTTSTGGSLLLESGGGTTAAGHVKLRPGGVDFLDVGPTICNFKRTYAGTTNIVTPGATTTLDLSTGNVQKVTLNQSSTIAFTNVQNGARYALHFVQDATGSRVATWPATIKVAGGGGPGALSTAVNAHDVMVLEADETGNLWLIAFVKNLS